MKTFITPVTNGNQFCENATTVTLCPEQFFVEPGKAVI